MKIQTKQFITRLRYFFLQVEINAKKILYFKWDEDPDQNWYFFDFEDVNWNKYNVESLNHKRATW